MRAELDTQGAEPSNGAGLEGYQLAALAEHQPSEGATYRATDTDTQAPVTITIVGGASHSRAERFMRDAAALRELRHPNIAPVQAFGESGDGLWLATAAPDGPSLGALIAAGPMPPMRVLRFLGEVADALDAAHRVDVLHRDLRPGSVLVQDLPAELATVCHFTLGLPATESLDRPEGLPYRSPEELRGEAASPASDRYSLACMLFEALTGRPPFAERHPELLRAAHLSTFPPRLTSALPDLPSELDDVLEHALAKDPGRRPSSCAELISEVSRVLMGPLIGPGGTVTAPTLPPAAEPEPRPQPEAEPVAAPAQPRAEPEPVSAPEPAAAPPPAPEPEPAAEPATPPRPAPVRPSPVALAVADARASLRARGRDVWRARLPLAAGLAAVAIAGIGGFLLGRPGKTSKQAAPRSLRAGEVAMTSPRGWQPAPPGATRGLDLADATAFAPRAGGARLTLGLAHTGAVFPAHVARRALTGNPRAEAVQLGSLQAVRYTGRSGNSAVSLFVIPASPGPVVVSCKARPVLIASCQRAANALSPHGSPAVSVSSLAAYARRVDGALTRLNRRRASGRRALGGARTPGAQAGAAASLARAHTRAAASLSGVPAAVGDPAQRAAGDLRSVARGYAALAHAARRSDRGGYRRAARSLRRGERALRRSLEAL